MSPTRHLTEGCRSAERRIPERRTPWQPQAVGRENLGRCAADKESIKASAIGGATLVLGQGCAVPQVLTLRLPRAAASQPRRIEVRAS